MSYGIFRQYPRVQRPLVLPPSVRTDVPVFLDAISDSGTTDPFTTGNLDADGLNPFIISALYNGAGTPPVHNGADWDAAGGDQAMTEIGTQTVFGTFFRGSAWQLTEPDAEVTTITKDYASAADTALGALSLTNCAAVQDGNEQQTATTITAAVVTGSTTHTHTGVNDDDLLVSIIIMGSPAAESHTLTIDEPDMREQLNVQETGITNEVLVAIATKAGSKGSTIGWEYSITDTFNDTPIWHFSKVIKPFASTASIIPLIQHYCRMQRGY